MGDPGYPTRIEVLREIWGNPFKPVTNLVKTPTILQMAGDAYYKKDWVILPIIADCLEDISCREQELLEHLRSRGPHYKGCWALDLILGYE